MKSSRGFTLIELLIVIAIIGILMALLFPAVQSAIETARRAQAKNDVTQIATAVVAYSTEYGRLPYTNSDETLHDLNGSVLNALMGSNDSSLNPRQLTFLEVQNKKNGKSGVTNGVFQDPWGHVYQIAFDTDYNNKITNSGTEVRKTVIVVTQTNGPYADGVTQTNKIARRYVTSWD